jgi:hypothetical protein
LDLGNNKLNSSIPGTWGGLTNLETFNVSENNLQGLIPIVLTTRFNASSFAGNPLLRATPLTGSQAIGHHHSIHQLVHFFDNGGRTSIDSS